ncbi:PLP-dependent aminotransferase family protein [Nostoc flagelliforme]|uniref:MocR-like pyridoxine biosynthesis transcription factor PdxR n=1 Tax=Nostoc flagelliforme TaxID=1306274 RepID=UPI0018F0465B|nr:PLP-dependent aminotransferase family protein [Nostoc flagelliforme]
MPKTVYSTLDCSDNENRAAILDGRLPAGEQLLPTRELASQLSVSRNTVMQAYDLLMSDGLLEGHVGAGTFVADIVSSDRYLDNLGQSAIEIKPFWRQLTDAQLLPSPPANLMYNFSLSLPDKQRFPFEEWRRICAFCSRRLAQAPVGYGPPEGMRQLREALVKYVSFSRAVRCHLDNVIVTNGAQQAFDLIARVLIEPQTVVAVEDPGYPPVRLLFESYGAQVVGVPVDAQGLRVECLPKNAKLIYVTPSHQFPLGMPMSLPRRLALLEWATQHGAAIIEDDYDSEFRFAGRPLESLQNLDRTGRVLYVGTFSKVMFPEIRLGFIVAPELIQQALVVAKQLSDLHSPLLAQATLAKFIQDGYLAKHIRKSKAYP